jgi:hypothetical protein
MPRDLEKCNTNKVSIAYLIMIFYIISLAIHGGIYENRANKGSNLVPFWY